MFYKIFSLYIKMSEYAYLTYYQKNRDVILNRAKDYYENEKERLRVQKINTETYLKEKKEDMWRIDIVICLKKRKKD